MKKLITTRHILDAEPNKVWAHISKASGVHEWLPVITSCHLEGSGVGARRICSTEQGDMDETILEIDHQRKRFRYAIDRQPLLPVSAVVGNMQVEGGIGKTILLWQMEYSIEDESLVPMVEEAVKEMYAAGAKGLEQLSRQQVTSESAS